MKKYLSIMALLVATQLVYGEEKKPLKFNPTNELEVLFAESSTNTESRIQFWTQLMNADVFVLGDVGQGTNATLNTWTSSKDEAAGVFTSFDKINEAMPKGTKYIKLKARVIFQSMKDENLSPIINPRFEHQIRLNVDDLELLLKSEYSKVTGNIP